MTAPVTPEKTLAQRMRENVSALREQGAPRERIQEEIDYWGRQMQAKGETEDALTPLQKAGSLAQTFSDAATLGVSGVLDDLLSPGSFTENRQARRAARESVAQTNPGLSTVAGVTGALATPLPGGGLLRAGARASKAARIGTAATDAALQSGIASGLTSLEGGSPEALRNMDRRALSGGLLGGALGGTLGGVTGALARTGERIRRTNALDDVAVQMRKDIAQVSNEGYERVLSQPAQPQLSRPMLNILTDPVVLPHVRELQTYRQWQGVRPSEPRFLDAVYKELSDEGLRLKQSLKNKAGEPGVSSIRARGEHIGQVRSEMLNAMDTQVPGYKDVVQTHAGMKADEEFFERASDVANRVGSGSRLKGKKYKTEGRAAFLEEIPKATPAQAMLGVSGLLGRGSESVHLTSSPLGLFGLMGSAVRVPLQAYRTREILGALEKQAGIKSADRAVSERVRGATARVVGAEEGRRKPY